MISFALRTRLSKAAADNGFDLELPEEGRWLAFGSSHCPLRIWLSGVDGAVLLVALSQPSVRDALGPVGVPFPAPTPPAGACVSLGFTDLTELHRLLRRAWQLSRALPDAPLRLFEERTATLPRATEAERLVVQRVGQDLFRAGLMDLWEGRCAFSGLAVPALLRASHIKPWADCATDAERLDVYNGLLLAAHLDAAFDAGFITVEADGRVKVSSALDEEARGILGLHGVMRVRGIADGHRGYLPWHWERVFRG